MITDLRFIERDGEKVLQVQKWEQQVDTSNGYYIPRAAQLPWQDVPTLKEDKEND